MKIYIWVFSKSFVVLTHLGIRSIFSYFLYMVWGSDMKVCLGVVKLKQFLIWAFEFISKKIPLKIWTVFVLFAFSQFHIPESHSEIWCDKSLYLLCYFTLLLPFLHLFQIKDSYYETISSDWESLPSNLVVDLNLIFN